MLLFLMACMDSDTTAVDSTGVDYNQELAPILRDNCVGCHQEGEIGPFELDDYDEVAQLAGQILDSVESRRMPPYLADASGECNTYTDAAWMSDADIQVLRDWVDQGLLEGDPAMHPGPPPAREELQDATHALLLDQVSVDFSGGDDNYRCFVVDPGVEQPGYLTAFEVLPGNAEIVHHLIVYAPSSDADVAQAYALDDADEQPGYQCFGDARVDSSMLAAWAPGSSVSRYPPGTGIKIEDRPVVVQIHYNNAGADSSDATVVNLVVEPEVETELFAFFWVDGGLKIPPGVEYHEEESLKPLSRYGIKVPLDLWSVGPHMHKLGTAEYGWVEHVDGSETCLMDVPRWDFNWQFGYPFQEPVRIGPEDEIGMRCVYDSTGVSETTYWGDGTSDEMCLMTLLVSVATD